MIRNSILIILLFSLSQIVHSAENEAFDSFLYKFSLDKQFQKERVKFPISRFYLDYPEPENGVPALDLEQMEEKFTQINWKHMSFYYNKGQQYRPQIFDNFEKKLRDTDQYVFSWQGIENGIEIYFYFQRIKGKWYLIKIEDLST